ncbi:MAG TPA: hypothetical protein VE991_04785, partial [Acidimicrobiales bacterium]|nr:hypothetical protein [Acidimicrobiales bacterium]
MATAGYRPAMRLVTFVERVAGDDPSRATATEPWHSPELWRTGVMADDEVVDLTDDAVGLPADMVALLTGGEGALTRAAGAHQSRARRLALDA